jgi:epoxyqueuosine reductase
MALTGAIKEEARALGFDAVGIARIDPSQQQVTHNLFDRLTTWLRRGYHGTMAWMGKAPEKRADPRLVLPGCRSIISVGVNYLTDHRADEQPGHGRIARYAWGKDYHKILGERLSEFECRIQALAPGAVTRSYVDTGPVMEKAWAERAGLGWVGKHSNLVSTQYGSWLLLGEVLTTLELEADEPASDLCGSCTLCIQACPTGAIVEPYVVDATRCISYLTIELRDAQAEIPDDLGSRLGNKIFGCDDCLDVCPFNLRATSTTEPAFQPTAMTLAPRLADLIQLTEEAFTTGFRDSPVRRAQHRSFLRNVRTVLKNQRPNG